MSYGWERGGPGEESVGEELRRRIWEPLEAHLEGATTVLVSPDGAISRVPLGALPGKDDGTYLIEEVSIAVIAVPQLVPTLLAAQVDPSAVEEPPSRRLAGPKRPRIACARRRRGICTCTWPLTVFLPRRSTSRP